MMADGQESKLPPLERCRCVGELVRAEQDVDRTYTLIAAATSRWMRILVVLHAAEHTARLRLGPFDNEIHFAVHVVGLAVDHVDESIHLRVEGHREGCDLLLQFLGRIRNRFYLDGGIQDVHGWLG